MSGIPAETPARPILEVYPDVSGFFCKGFVHLLLLVNEKGNIESAEVIQNSTGSNQCGEMAVEAAKKSQWMPASVDNKSVSSWVEKIYKFNINR
jgi:TonB family protein